MTADPQAVPLLDELDPERCYLTWKITVQTAADPERLRDVFLFVSEDCTVGVVRRLVDGTPQPVPLDSGVPRPSTTPTAADFLAPGPVAAAGVMEAPFSGGLAPAEPSGSNGSTGTPLDRPWLPPLKRERPRKWAVSLLFRGPDRTPGSGLMRCSLTTWLAWRANWRSSPTTSRASRKLRDGPLAACAGSSAAGQPADPGHDARVADGPRR